MAAETENKASACSAKISCYTGKKICLIGAAERSRVCEKSN